MSGSVRENAPPDPDGSADEPPVTRDRVVRALADDDTFRVIVAVTTETARGAIAAQQATGATARHFAELLTGAVLVRETMSPHHRVQVVLKGAGGRGSLVADAHPDGMTRGLVKRPDGDDDVTFGPGNSLLVMRGGAQGMYRSVTAPPEGGGVAEALMLYLQSSEEIISVIAVGTHEAEDGDHAWIHCGGYVVQLLPGAARGPLMVMTERLAAMPSVGELLANAGGNADELLAELLYLMPHAKLGDSNVHHGCLCDERAVLASLATLPREDLIELTIGDDVLEIACDYCTKDYAIRSTQLQGLLAPS